jgi:hypothetical protein
LVYRKSFRMVSGFIFPGKMMMNNYSFNSAEFVLKIESWVKFCPIL